MSSPMNDEVGAGQFPGASFALDRSRLRWVMLAVQLVAFAPAASSEAGGIAGARCAVGGCAVPAAAGIVVTQFAVPVAVPQYAVPVAPQSYVQYGGGQIAPAPSGSQPTNSNETVEDRIAAKILARLTSAGVIKPEALPSLVSKTCATCHSGPRPKAGLDLSDARTLTPELKLTAINRVLADDEAQRMPPPASGAKLSPEDIGRLLQELSTAPRLPAAPADSGSAVVERPPQPGPIPNVQPAAPAPAPAERIK
jgi:hypothetical protein